MKHRPIGPLVSREHPAAVQHSLVLLSRRSVLLAVTLQTWVAGCQVDITVSKVLDEAGQWTGQYWWEVDRLAVEGTGEVIREKRWALGLCPYATAEAAYAAAVQAMEQGSGGPAAEQAVGASAGGTTQSV